MSEQSNGGWPDPARPGVPIHPERGGYHWLSSRGSTTLYIRLWDAYERRWNVNALPSHVAADADYHGPCAEPAAIAALRAALQPFADAADNLDARHLDRADIWDSDAARAIDAGHLRRAQAALSDAPHGPCLLPAEVAAQVAAAERRGIEKAARKIERSKIGQGLYRVATAAAIRALLTEARDAG